MIISDRYSHLVHEYYVSRVRGVMSARDMRIRNIRTQAQAVAYCLETKRKLRRIFGPFPKRTPLRTYNAGKKDLGDCFLEKICFESRPGFFVTGNAYVPLSDGKHPCVLGLCGHSASGKSYANYQSFARGLAMKGFVSLIIDPIEQGERRQFSEIEYGKGKYDLCAWHNRIGKELAFVGEFFGSWLLWDAIRALDYLLSRGDVDHAHVGVTGCSGGGTLTSYLAAVDPRTTMLAPVCSLSSFLSNLENEVAADIEQNPPGILEAGLDQADFFMGFAPRPLLILAEKEDFFDVRGTRKAFEEIRKIYGLLGKRENVGFEIGPLGHGYHRHARESMYNFFMRRSGLEGDPTEPEFDILPEADLKVFSEGNILENGSKGISAFTAGKAEMLKRGRDAKFQKKTLQARLKKALKIRYEKTIPHYRILRGSGGVSDELNMVSQFSVETENGIQCIFAVYGKNAKWTSLPVGKIVFFIGDSDSQKEVSGIEELKKITQCTDRTLVAFDPRGMGQTFGKSFGQPEFHHPYGSDFMYAAYSDMLGETYVGKRVWDVLMTMNLLYANGVKEIEIIGNGAGGAVAVFAAFLHPGKTRAKLINSISSYEGMIGEMRLDLPYSSIPRNILEHLDITDFFRHLGIKYIH